MLKRISITTLLLVLFTQVSIIKADSWKIFETGFTYLDGSMSLSNRIPKDRSILKAFRTVEGNTLLVMSQDFPITINRSGNFINNTDENFENLEYTPSLLSSVIFDNNKKAYFQNTSILAYYDADSKTWLGINVRNGKATGTIPSLELDNIFGMTFDKDNNLFLTGSKDNKPVIAKLKNSVWEVTPIHLSAFPTENTSSNNLKDELLNLTNIAADFKEIHIMSSPVLNGDGSIWVALGIKNYKGLIRISEDGTAKYYQSQTFNKICSDYRGNVICSTEEGIKIIRSGSTEQAPFIEDKATTLFADQNALWYSFSIVKNTSNISSNTESVYMKRYDFETEATKLYTSENTTFDKSITSISGDETGNIVFLSGQAIYILDNVDLSKYEDKWEQYSRGYIDELEYLKKDIISINKNGKHPATVSWDEWNNRWLGVYQDNKWNYYKIAVEQEAGRGLGLKGTYPNTACYTSKGIFLGTYNDGLMLFDPKTEKATSINGYDQKVFGKDVRDIAEDKNGNIWIATNKGLISYDGTTFKLFDKKTSDFKSNKVNCLHITTSGILWVGTGGDGIYSFDGTNWTAYTKKQGLKGGNISCLTSVGETIYSSDQNFLRVSNKLYTIDKGVVSVEELPFYIQKNSLDTDNNGNLWIIGLKRAIICRKADGSSKTYDPENSPIGYSGSGNPYFMSGYTLDDKLYVRTTHNPLNEMKFESKPGQSAGSQSPLEAKVKSTGNKANTFDASSIYIMDIK